MYKHRKLHACAWRTCSHLSVTDRVYASVRDFIHRNVFTHALMSQTSAFKDTLLCVKLSLTEA